MGIILLKNSREKLLDFLVKKNRGSGWQYNGDREKADFLNSCFGLSLPVNWEEALKADVGEVAEKEHCLLFRKQILGPREPAASSAGEPGTMSVIWGKCGVGTIC